ncbi:MAG: GNAT family N-acetyltransferase [Chloroflexota bacterium]
MSENGFSGAGCAGDLLNFERPSIRPFFAPNNVALVGASDEPGSVGNTLLRNLVQNDFAGAVFPVNPKYERVMGIQAYPDVTHLPAPTDLAVIATPAPTVPGIIAQCAQAGVKAAIIVSAGFKEAGERGREREREILAQARQAGLRIVGPNCLGIMDTRSGLNATFAAGMARPGKVAFLSQSGALATAILDWSLGEKIGFSAFVSVGSMLDADWAEMIAYLGDDPETESIVMYMETVGDAAAFLTAARQVAAIKPILVLKPGRTEGAARAAASHTGSLTGSDDVLDAAFCRAGVLRVDSISDLFDMTEVLARQPRPTGPQLTIVTNAGGPGVLATDALLLGGAQLRQLPEDVLSALDAFLPAAWSHANPVDILGDATPERYNRAVEVAVQDARSDGLLVILTPQSMTDAVQTAERLRAYAGCCRKPILASWMGGGLVEGGAAQLNEAGIPTFAYPDAAARAFGLMWRYENNLRALCEVPGFAPDGGEGTPDRTRAQTIIQAAQSGGRTLLTEFETKQLLAAYGIPTVPTRVAASENEAVKLAGELGYPAVLKVHAETITHKTDIGGVRLNLNDEEAVRRAYRAIAAAVREQGKAEGFEGVSVQPMLDLDDGYELILGSSLDRQFGPVLLFGSGGQLVEVYRDRALALPPLNRALAQQLIARTRIHRALQGVRGRPPVDVRLLEDIIVRFSRLVFEQTAIQELDINPLFAAPGQVIALDGRAVLRAADSGPLPLPALQPYPLQYMQTFEMEDGVPVSIRPVRPDDTLPLLRFYKELPEATARLFLAPSASQRNVQDRFTRLCFPDYRHAIAFVAEKQEGDGHRILAVARLDGSLYAGEAHFSALVADRFRNLGLGSELLRRALQFGRAAAMKRVVIHFSHQNEAMEHICDKFGFRLLREQTGDRVRAEVAL